MRKQFVETVENLFSKNQNLVLLLGDISVHGFRLSFENYKSQIYNIGILEQSTIGLAAGLAKTNLIPIVHTIAPFLIERSYEQLKIDFGYQKLGGNFVSVGASYDYAALGCTHHCPADVSSLLNIPNFEIAVPGNANEFDSLFDERSPYRNTLNKGMPLGNLTSQIFANIYLNEFDHWVKEVLREKYYIRYVDDLVFLAEHPSQLHALQILVIQKLEQIGLTVNPKKISIRSIDKGIPFLGYIVWKNHISAGKFLRKGYNKALRRRVGQDNQSSMASYAGILKHTGATR
jgi:deoxyxylulose-5-phosphate synthase